jgi:hypothetical protein
MSISLDAIFSGSVVLMSDKAKWSQGSSWSDSLELVVVQKKSSSAFVERTSTAPVFAGTAGTFDSFRTPSATVDEIFCFCTIESMAARMFEPRRASLEKAFRDDNILYCGGIAWMYRRSARSSRQQNE